MRRKPQIHGRKTEGNLQIVAEMPRARPPEFLCFFLPSSFLLSGWRRRRMGKSSNSTVHFGSVLSLVTVSHFFFWCNNPPKLTTFKHLPHVCVSACLFVFRVCVCVGLWCVHCWRREGGGKGRAKREKERKESAQHPALFFVRVRHVTGAVRKKGCASAAAGVMRTAGSYASMRATASQKHA